MKTSGQPSLSSSKMATPVPVVSMMYFLVLTPPKTTGEARPAFSAISVKCARGLAPDCRACAERRWKGASAATASRKTQKQGSKRWVGPEIMKSWHTKMRVPRGQGDGWSPSERAQEKWHAEEVTGFLR